MCSSLTHTVQESHYGEPGIHPIGTSVRGLYPTRDFSPSGKIRSKNAETPFSAEPVLLMAGFVHEGGTGSRVCSHDRVIEDRERTARNSADVGGF